MDARQFVLGIVILLVFWAFQAGYFSSLGPPALFVGAIIFVILTWIIGKGIMPNPPAENKQMWNFVVVFLIIVSIIASFVPPNVLGAVLPAGFDFSMVVPFILALWLVLFGAAMFVTGHEMKMGMAQVIGLIWLFSAITFVGNAGPNAYLHFGIVTGLTFILGGIFSGSAGKK